MKEHPMIRGMGLGMAAGAVVGMMAASKKKAIKSTARRAIRAVEDTAENVSSTLGL